MRSAVIIKKRGEVYVATVSGKFDGVFQGAKCGLTIQEAASIAAEWMIRYATSNVDGGDLMAPPEVMELVPEHLRSIAANKMLRKIENTHGGARPGSGRKKMDTGKKQRITFTLSDDVIDFLKSNRPASRTLELAVREYANRLEQRKQKGAPA